MLRIDQLGALPYVARLAGGPVEYPKGSAVVSVGIDLGTKLTSWTGRLVKSVSMAYNGNPEERRFLITNRTPEHGRSGGGLFLAGGELVGVCVGHAELVKGRELGVYSSLENVRLLLEDAKLTAVVAVSQRRSRRSNRLPAGTTAYRASDWPVVTATRSGSEERLCSERRGASEAVIRGKRQLDGLHRGTRPQQGDEEDDRHDPEEGQVHASVVEICEQGHEEREGQAGRDHQPAGGETGWALVSRFERDFLERPAARFGDEENLGRAARPVVEERRSGRRGRRRRQ